MKVYVCYGIFKTPLHRHACRAAFLAVRDAGYEPEEVRAYGFGALPNALNFTKGRREVRKLTGGSNWVPVLVTDDGEVVQGSKKIIAWAADHPADKTSVTTA